jgi:hypothetical protein
MAHRKITTTITDTPFRTLRNNIKYWERNSFSAHFGENVGEVTRLLICDWYDSYQLLTDLMGEHILDADKKVRRHLPEAHPSFTSVWANDATFAYDIGPPTRDDVLQCIVFDYAAWFVKYVSVAYDLYEDSAIDDSLKPGFTGTPTGELLRYVIRTEQTSVEGFALPGGWFRFADNQPVPEGGHLPSYTETLTWEWLWLPAKPTGYYDIMSCVNEDTFDGKAPGTLLFVGGEPRRMENSHDGNKYWRIKYQAIHRPEATWQKVFRPSSGVFETITHKTTGNPPFKTANFMDFLFTKAFP